MVTAVRAAVEPPPLPGLDPKWSRLVTAEDSAGVPRTWHVLDNDAEPVHGTMLCVHGNPTWSYLWRRFLAQAPPGWRVLAVDQLGMGFSERTAEPRRFAQRVADLADPHRRARGHRPGRHRRDTTGADRSRWAGRSSTAPSCAGSC